MKLIFTMQGRLGNLFYIFSAFYYALKHNINSQLILHNDYKVFWTENKLNKILYNKIKKFVINNYDKTKYINLYEGPVDNIELEDVISENYNTTNTINFDFVFFQTCKYFLKYKDNIKKYFTYENNNTNKYKNIISDNDVLISVRQGDYYGAGYYVLNKEFYIDMYNQYFSSKNIYITSDDINWCKENLTIDKFINCTNIYYINDLHPIEIATISQYFSNFICANSTFSMMLELLSNCENKKAIGVINISSEIIKHYAFDDKCIIYDLNDPKNYKYITKYN